MYIFRLNLNIHTKLVWIRMRNFEHIGGEGHSLRCGIFSQVYALPNSKQTLGEVRD